MLRYQKGKALSPQVGAWQSAILLGYLLLSNTDKSQIPEGKLCVTIDAYSAVVHMAQATQSIGLIKWNHLARPLRNGGQR